PAPRVPRLRTAWPIIIAAVVLNGLLVIDQELIIPQMIPKLIRSHDEIQQTSVKTFPIRAMQDEGNGLLNAARYHPPVEGSSASMEMLDVINFDKHFMP